MHLLGAKCDIRTVQELLGHTDVSMTIVFPRVFGYARGKRQEPSGFVIIPGCAERHFRKNPGMIKRAGY